jgi:polygalacturonase
MSIVERGFGRRRNFPRQFKSDKQISKRGSARPALEMLESRLVLSAPPLPVIPTGSGHLFVITAAPYNAKGDGSTDNTTAIQNAINDCSAAGGGVVEVPAASAAFEAGALSMASNVDLQIDSGAMLQAKSGLSGSVWISVSNCNNWEITGLGSGSTMGTLDGHAAGGTGSLNMIKLSGATVGLIQNVNVNNSPHEHIQCGGTLNNNITINGVTINTPSGTANTDGIDPAGTNWLIENCQISDGDDDIALKPGQQFCANITIQNCTILFGHGISIGGQTNFGLNGMTVTNCTFNGTTNGLRLKAGEGNGGLVQNVSYSNITMTNVTNPIIVNSYYTDGSDNYPSDPTSDKGSPPDATTPIWDNITFTNVSSTNASSSGNAGIVFGLPDEPVNGLHFYNVNISAHHGMEINHARNVTFDSLSRITAATGPSIAGIAEASSSFPTPVDAQITEAGYTNTDIGSPTIPFDTSESLYNPDTNLWTIEGGGAGIAGTSDQFNATFQPVAGDSTFTAQLTGLTGPGGSAVSQAGVMYRLGTGAGDPFAAVVQNTSGQILFEWRTTSGGTMQSATPVSQSGSVYLQITRSGSNFSGFYSLNGTSWTQIGSAVSISAIGSTANAGLAVSAGSNGSLAAGSFANVAVSGGSSNQAPTVATPASASPNPVTGNSTALSVLGADDGGESNLTYTWSDTGPSGVTFSANGTNAAKNATAAFTAAGSYNFTVTITDSGGLSTTSSVAVTVNQTLTSIALTPTSASVAENGTQQFSASGKDQFGATLSSQPTFTWALASGSVGSISSSGLYTAPATTGSATVQATSGGVTGTAGVTVTAVNQAPTVATPASASPSPVTGKTTSLSVLGADDGGESNLTYTWSDTGPSGVTFSANGTNAAKNSTATFAAAGSYNFTVTIKDSGGLSTTSSVAVTVSQTVTTITLTPSSASIAGSSTQQFSASAKDQFGTTLTTQPTFTWTLASGSVGSVSSTGLYTAPATSGSATVQATSGGVTATASVTVTAVNQPPTVATPASASPSPVTGKTTSLSVLGADDGGESNLTYTWSDTGPSGVTFSANGTNAAKNTTATFAAAGSYTFTVTIKDSGGLSTTSSVAVTVNQTLTTIAVTPTSASISANTTQQFSASGKDQFGSTLTTQPTFTWTLASGSVGSISSSGLYSAGSAAGTATVQATSGGVTGTAAVTVTAASTVTHVNLSSSYNRIGLSTDGQTFSGTGIDTKGNAYSSTLLNASSLASTYTLGAPGVNDVVAAANQTITLPQGNYSTLTFLGSAFGGKKTGRTFVVHYTDGTSQTYTINLSNFDAPQNYPGESVALTMSYYNNSSGGRTTSTVYLYQYTLTLNNAKTVASITMPGATDSIIIVAMNLNP